MAERIRPTVTIIPPHHGQPRVYGNRLATEHDQNDTIGARLDWYKKYHGEIEAIKKEAISGAHKKFEETQKKNFASLPTKFFVMQLLVVLEIYLLKTMHLI